MNFKITQNFYNKQCKKEETIKFHYNILIRKGRQLQNHTTSLSKGDNLRNWRIRVTRKEGNHTVYDIK